MQLDQFVEQFRRALADADPRSTKTARIRLLLPIIERRLENGSSYAAIVEDLDSVGISVSRSVFARTIWRIRHAKNAASAPLPLVAIGVQASQPPPDSPAVQGRPSSIESPADLRKFREMNIDLDALREEGRAMRAGPKSS
ncbi:hypothetical protein [Alcaligenes sp. GCM10023179]|uniref:hypothetical protein n=1 Tax=Alcaligenes sp. GCM10023179 TaxID=3252633 RepID=UPI0036130129